jgi:hypothetical protein
MPWGRVVRRGSFANVPDLIEAIFEFVAASNEEGRPFVWKAAAEELLVKHKKCRQRLEQISPGGTAPRRRRKAAA